MNPRIARIFLGLPVALLIVWLPASPALGGRPVPAFRAGGGTPAVAPPVSRSPLNEYQRTRLRELSAVPSASFAPLFAQATDDTLRLAVFQVQFTDSLMGGQPGSNRPQLRDSTWFDYELQHVAQYYRGASRQRFHVRWTLDGRLHTLSKRMTYYGADATEETRVVELAQEVIALADDAIDFADYDFVFIIHAGAGQETDIAGDSPNQIWSSFYDRSDIRRALDDEDAPGLATGDTRGGSPHFVDNFAVVPSHASQDFVTVGTLGLWTYQVGSRIGLVPLFDSTPTGAPDSQGVGGFCLMGYGLFNVNGFVPSFPCAFNRVLAGWVAPLVVDPHGAQASLRLADINTGAPGDTVLARVPITENEYWLVENRVHDANFDSLFTFTDNDSDLIPDNTESLEGAEFDFFLTDLTNPAVVRYSADYGFDVLYRHTGSGMYVWHVDERVIRDAVEQGFLPDDFVARKGVDLEEADGVQDLDRGGPAAFALGSFFDSFRAGDDNHAVFGPDTKPASRSNSGAATGIEISTPSAPGPFMRADVRRDIPYADTRVRWGAASPGQPATPVDLDGDGSVEIVVLSDSAGVFVFTAAGVEWDDADNNPATIAPYIAVPDASWTGPPAFANLDGAADVEMVAASKDGRLFAWKADGSELADGDANPGTTGVLFAGAEMIAPPMLLDVDGGAPEVLVAERDGASVRFSFVGASGGVVDPAGAVSALWPLVVPGQFVAPMAEARLEDGATTTIGIVAAVLDTTRARVGLYWVPAAFSGASPTASPVPRDEFLSAAGADPASFILAPACGDLDGDGDDEVVLALASGQVTVFDFGSAFDASAARETGTLRAQNPSAPALGDADDDGGLEIALWDDEYMYLLESNARVLTEWPRPIRLESQGEAPPARARREFESPLFADLGGDDGADVLFALDDGTLAAFTARGEPVAGFPRVGPSEAGAAPSIASLPAGNAAQVFASLVVAGSSGTLAGVDAVADSVATDPATALSIQSLPDVVGALPWPLARANARRTGRVEFASPPPAAAAGAYDAGSFMIYPNPVTGGEVNARVLTHARATIGLSVYTLEGQEAVARTFTVNPNGLANTPFDETVDVHTLKSGVYLMRLRIESAAGSGSLVKTFAVRR